MKLSQGLFLFFFTAALHCFPQKGRMLLVGGGSEKNAASGWSTPAYRWAVEGKRVAVIGTSTGSLAPYLTQYCGASFAREFGVSTRDSADSQVLYDTLLTYQAIFFRGGDQYEYYELYRNTKLQQAVIHLYESGGTICGTSAGMHILSEVVFTAQNGTAYPDDCIENPNNQDVKLANDFFQFMPGYLFDTHFAERARFGRLTAFMANYKLNKGLSVTGIGMDDMTCMTVDTNNLGTVYGTGCANIYKPGAGFSLNSNKLLVDSMQVIQLLQGCTFDFNTQEVSLPTLDKQLDVTDLQESGNYTVLATGSNKITENQAMLSDLVSVKSTISDTVFLLTGNKVAANPFVNYLLQLGAPGVETIEINLASYQDAGVANQIERAGKFLFVANATADFNSFLLSPNGKLLKNATHRSGMINSFVGDDSRYAGKTVVDNYYELYASYYAEMTFSKGLCLLEYSVIMPNTFYNSDMYENSVTAVPYAMALDTLRYGIWLTNHNYMKYEPVNGFSTLSGYGSAPVMVLKNEGLRFGFSTQTGTGSSGTKPRMVAGFENLQLSLIDYTTPYRMGNTGTFGTNENTGSLHFGVKPNPVTNILQVEFDKHGYKWHLESVCGQILLSGTSVDNTFYLDLSSFKPGIYLFVAEQIKTGRNAVKKIIKQ
jgi:cyanophycinase